MACADIDFNGPDANWPDWWVPGDTAGQVRVPFDWSGYLAPGKQIEIKGIAGDVRAIRASGTDVVVTATRIGHPTNLAAVTIAVVPHGLGVTICAVYPDVPGHAPNACEPGNAGNMSVRDSAGGGVRVEFVVEVPDGVVFAGRTLSGDVVATGLDSDVLVSTMLGDVRVSTARLATAKTMWGSVVASIGLADWGRDLEFSTMTGDVRVTVPATTNAQVVATVQSGSITSDFPLTQVFAGEKRGTIGQGGPTLKLATLAGNVTLRSGG